MPWQELKLTCCQTTAAESGTVQQAVPLPSSYLGPKLFSLIALHDQLQLHVL